MKKTLTKLVALFSLTISTGVFANSQQILIERLEKTEGFSANFTQQVYSPDQELVMEGEGTVEVARPDLFRWSAEFPDENLLVSDGQSLWYYSPFIEQVSIFDQQQATAQTPFVLLTRNNASDWSQYTITNTGDAFTLSPKDPNTTQGQFIIQISESGVIQGFKVIEQDGQRSEFGFSNFDSTVPEKTRFNFIAPKGVEIDDQRSQL